MSVLLPASADAKSLTEFLHAHLPLARAAGIVVAESVPGRVRLTAPLASNVNHHGTAFGGSLAMLGITTGWTLLQASLQREGLNATLVIADSHCRYLIPVRGDLMADAILTDAALAGFFSDLRQKGRAKLEVESELRSALQPEQKAAALHRGLYAAVLQS